MHDRRWFVTWSFSSLQSQDLQLFWGHIVSLLLLNEGRQVGGQSDAREVVFHRQEDFGVDAIEHPLGLDVESDDTQR